MDSHIAPNAGSNRFTKEEKHILFQLFAENEEIIDIKQRKTCPKKNISIRECWNKITTEYNNHPNITTPRNLKQIQKFWLNARLRKSYPGGNAVTSSSLKGSNENLRRLSTTESNASSIANNTKQTIINNSSPTTVVSATSTSINPPKLIRISHQQNDNDSNHYETIKYEKDCDSEEIEMVTAEEEEEDITQEVEISTSSNDVNMVENESHSQQYSIDHISAEKLTLNDLLEFKNNRNRDEIVLQIRTTDPHPCTTSVTANPVKESNQNQNYSTTSYRISHPINQATIIQDNYTSPNSSYIQPAAQAVTITPHTTSQAKVIHQSTVNPSPGFYQNTNQTTSSIRSYESFDEKLNYYQLKEAELKYKEGQIRLEKMKIDLQKSKEELKNLRELHAYQIKEMEIRLRLAADEDKRLKMARK